MEEEVIKVYDKYKSNKISLGELYVELLHIQYIYKNKEDIEPILINIIDVDTIFLLLTYQNSNQFH